MKPQNLLALLLFIAGAAWALTRSEHAVLEIQKTYYNSISYVVKSGSAFDTTTSEFLKEAEHSEEWKARYKLAKEELDKKRMEVAHLRKLEEENAQLSQALKFQQETPFHVIAAKILRRQPSTWWHTVTVNRGEKQGIGVQLPVLSPEGLVGKIDTPSNNTSTVILLTDEKCKVSAKVDGTHELGILSGQRGLTGQDPIRRLSFLSKDAKISTGMRVFTTGRGKLFPPDILLGTVQSFESGPLYGEAIVKPAVDFATLHTVFVKLPHSPEESAR